MDEKGSGDVLHFGQVLPLRFGGVWGWSLSQLGVCPIQCDPRVSPGLRPEGVFCQHGGQGLKQTQVPFLVLVSTFDRQIQTGTITTGPDVRHPTSFNTVQSGLSVHA